MIWTDGHVPIVVHVLIELWLAMYLVRKGIK